MLKKPFHGLYQPQKRKTRFPVSFIVNGLLDTRLAYRALMKSGALRRRTRLFYCFLSFSTKASTLSRSGIFWLLASSSSSKAMAFAFSPSLTKMLA